MDHEKESDPTPDSATNPEPEQANGVLDVIGRALVGFAILVFSLAGVLVV